ncbi:MAG TPA: hypothetical protein VJ732_14635 [Bryobacteraceae bacterium]|nr:hypothetical protein [Bryobacteraceae bacterium]
MRPNTIFFCALALASAGTGFSQIVLNSAPSRVIGSTQLALTNLNPNLVEGRELYSPQGVALDNSVSPPMVYVADTVNNRVLAWKNAVAFNNGAKADLVIGQHDFVSTFAQGPGTAMQTGLNSPTGLTVYNGDLYVVDSGNNRVLRYPKPFAHAGVEFPDLYIGQPNLNSKAPNYTGVIGPKGIALTTSSQTFRASVAFDSSGNLWLTDAVNRRVLRFPAAQVAGGGGPLQADLEFGQVDLNSFAPMLDPSNPASRQIKNQLSVPSGIAIDSAGRVYVSDSDPNNAAGLSRVLVYEPPFFSGQAARRVMGVVLAGPNGQPPTQDTIDRTVMVDPEGIFFLPGNAGMGVVDSQSSRILIFDYYDKWPAESSAYSPAATAVIGQNNAFSTRGPNAGLAKPSGLTLAFPVAAQFAGSELFVADTLNNRVIVMPYQGGVFSGASRVLGQDRLDTNSINLIEGREFQFTAKTTLGQTADADVVVDTSDPSATHLYVADPYNNRVLGFRDARQLGAGSKADLVIGQPDLQTALCNYDSSNAYNSSPDRPNQSGLCRPTGLLVDANGNLYVADSANGRVLRFPKPFAGPAALPTADLVLGQQDFTSKITDPSPQTMNTPYGLAMAGDRGLLVSDQRHNRVLLFPAVNGTFTSGEAATEVFGQPDFFSTNSGSDDTSLNAPHHIAADGDTRIYVVDSGNNRVVIYDKVFSAAPSGAHAIEIIPNLGAPRGIYVNQTTGEIFVGDFNNNRILRYPRFDNLVLTNTPTATIPAASPLAVALDANGDLYTADAANRVTIYFPGMQALNGATFLANEPLAPGAVASLCAPQSNCVNGAPLFGTQTAQASGLPLPNTLGGLQVTFNGQPTPLYYVSPTQINFVVPENAPTSGYAEIEVVASTGQIMAASLAQMNVVSPGIIRLNFAGANDQAAVLNQDNSVNGPSNPAPRGSVIQIFATGEGAVAGAPPDGSAPSGPVPAGGLTQVIVGICNVDDSGCTQESGEHIKYSGLSSYPGVWQINVQIPQNTAPGAQVPIVVLMNSYPSSDANSGFRTVIAVQ